MNYNIAPTILDYFAGIGSSLAEPMPDLQQQSSMLASRFMSADAEYSGVLNTNILHKMNREPQTAVGTHYSIKLASFNDKKLKQYGLDIMDADKLYRIVKQSLDLFLSKRSGLEVILFFELGAETLRLHAHGLVRSDNKLLITRFFAWWRRKYGFLNFCPYYNNKLEENKWASYISKEHLFPVYLK